MKPSLAVEFRVKSDDTEFTEESVTLQNPEDLFEFVAPGGGCESLSDDLAEIQMVFLPPEHRNQQNAIADIHSTLQLGMVFINGPLAKIVQTAEQLLDKAGRGELSEAFLRVIHAKT